MKKWIAVLCAVALLIGTAGCQRPEYAALVNGEPITMEELDREVEAYRLAMEGSGFGGDPEDPGYMQTLREETLDVLIREMVLHQKLAEYGIGLDLESAREYVDMIKYIYGEEMFYMILEMNGIDEDRFLEDFAFNEALGKLRTRVTEDVGVREDEVLAYFEANRDSLVQGVASHILVRFDWEMATEEEIEAHTRRANDLIARLDEGADFAELAQAESDDTSAPDGGRLDTRFSMTESPFVDEFTVAALSLDAGAYTAEPVASAYGYHIIRLDERYDSFEELRGQAEMAVLHDARNRAFAGYVEEWVDQSEVENHIRVQD